MKMLDRSFIRIELRRYSVIGILVFWKREDRSFRWFQSLYDCLKSSNTEQAQVCFALELIWPPQKQCSYFLPPSKSKPEISPSYCGWAFSGLLALSLFLSFLKQQQWISCNQHLSASRIPPSATDVPSQPELQIVRQLYHSLPLMMCRHPRSFATQHNRGKSILFKLKINGKKPPPV